MAEFSGAHVEMGIAVKTGGSELFYPIWSETIAPGSASNQAARNDKSLSDIAAGGMLVFRVRANAAGPIFVARGQAPDPSPAVSTNRNSVRSHLLASESRDFPAMVGDKVKCSAAV